MVQSVSVGKQLLMPLVLVAGRIVDTVSISIFVVELCYDSCHCSLESSGIYS